MVFKKAVDVLAQNCINSPYSALWSLFSVETSSCLTGKYLEQQINPKSTVCLEGFTQKIRGEK